MNKILFLSSEDIVKTFSMEEAIETMSEAFIQLSTGKAVVPVRQQIDMPEQNGTSFFMPVYIPEKRNVGIKIVAVNNDNPSKNLPRIHAMVILFDASNGKPLAVMDGEQITAIRTGAASGLATNILSRKNSKIVTIIGAGIQGKTQLEAVSKVRNIEQAFVISKHFEKAKNFANEMKEKLSINVQATEDYSVLEKSDIICTATTSQKPVFSDKNIKPGTHINGVGSYKSFMQEIPEETILRSKLFVDSKDACFAEAGDIIIPIKKKIIDKNHIFAEIGEAAGEIKKGRETDNEITIFKSVGNAVQDLTSAIKIFEKSKKLNLGTEINL